MSRYSPIIERARELRARQQAPVQDDPRRRRDEGNARLLRILGQIAPAAGTAIGAGVGTLVAPGVGTGIGAAIGGGIGSAAGTGLSGGADAMTERYQEADFRRAEQDREREARLALLHDYFRGGR